MTCPYSAETLALYVEGDLPSSEYEAVKAHVARCPDCEGGCQRLLRSQSLFKSLRREPLDQFELVEARQHVFDVIDSDRDLLGWAVKTERFVFDRLRSQRYALAGGAVLLIASILYGLYGFGWNGDSLVEGQPIVRAAEPSSIDSGSPAPAVGSVVNLEPEAERVIGGRESPVPEVSVRIVEPPLEEVSVTLREPTLADQPVSQSEQVLVRVLTNRPDIIIYWLIDGERGGV